LSTLRFSSLSDSSYSTGRSRTGMDLALLTLRLTLGLTMMAHGAQKLFGWFGGRGFEAFVELVGKMGFQPAGVFAALAAGSEFIGGLMVALGVFAELGALGIIFTMLVAIWKITGARGFFINNNGYEYNILIIAVCVALILSGPGRYALWRLRR
jgi:putative oxidoreductase